MMEQSRVLAALSALANETRLELVRVLIVAGQDGLAAGQIARALDVSASRLSFHLGALEQAGLIGSRRLARNVIYSADHDALGGVIGYLLNDCCAGHPDVCARCTTEPDRDQPGTSKT